MFIDYVSLLLINMAAALVVLAVYLVKNPDVIAQKSWSPAFALCGLIAAVAGFNMVLTWPLPGPYNSAFGEMSIFLGMLFLAAAWMIAAGWKMAPLSIPVFFFSGAAIVLGFRIMQLGLTQTPRLAGGGFIVTGLAGVMVGLVLCFKNHKLMRFVAAGLLIIAAAIWSYIGYYAYWAHMAGFAHYVPLLLREAGK